VIDAEKNQIEPPCANAACLQKSGHLRAEFFDDAFQILRVADRLCEFDFNARHIDRNKRRQRFIGVAKGLIEPQQKFAPKRRRRLARGLVANCATRSMPTSRSEATVSLESRSAATGRLAIASGARPGE